MTKATRYAIPLLIAGLALLATPAARAESSFLWPQLGLGAGPTTVAGERSIGASLDFNLGVDFELQGPFATGFTAGFDLERSNWDVQRDWGRFSLTSLWTFSIGHTNPWPFLRVGAGPSLTFTTIAPDHDVRVGGGLTIEAAMGFRSIIELYAQGTSVVDSAGVASSFTAGLRLNVIIFDAIFGGGSHFHGGSGNRGHGVKLHGPKPSVPHRAVPAGSN